MVENMKKFLIYSAIMFVVSAVLAITSRFSMGFSEWYAVNIYPIFACTIGRFFSLFPISVSEILLMILIAASLFGLVFLLIRLKQSKFYRKEVLAKAGTLVACVTTTALFIFVLNCGINYNREPFLPEEETDEFQSYTQDDLMKVFLAVADELEKITPQIRTDEDGDFMLTGDVAVTSRSALKNLSREFPRLDVCYPRPKPVLTSRFMSDAKILGVFSPFTIEANYNNHAFDSERALTAIHELVHVAGFMREEEANFIAFLAARESGDPELIYSALLNAASWLRLEIDRFERLSDIEDYIHEQAFHDLRRQQWFWWERANSFENVYSDEGEVVDVIVNTNPVVGVIADVSSAVNDGYLRSQGQEDGIESYGRMVDFVVMLYLDEMEDL
jgi:AAA+ ATPase superfamily predicted ATPase